MPLGIFNHPILFAAAAVIAIGVVIYEIVSSQEGPHSGGRRPPPGGPKPPKPPRPPNNSQKPPSDSPKKTESVSSECCEISDKSTIVKHPVAPDNNLRKRNINQTSNKLNSLPDSRNGAKDTSSVTALKTSELLSSSSSEDSPGKKFEEINYSRNMLDKLTSDTKNINENIKKEKCLGHNICEEDSDSPESNLIPKDEVKLINQTNGKTVSHSKRRPKRKKQFKHAGLKTAKNNNDNSDQHQAVLSSGSDSHSDDSVTFAPTMVTKTNSTEQRHSNKNSTSQISKSQFSNLHPEIDFHQLPNSGSDIDKNSSCSDEDRYKRQLYESLENDVYGIKDERVDVDNSTVSTPERMKEEKPTDSKICRACEEKQVNTCASPCNHSYLCVDCAVRVFRIYRKCAICHVRVEEFLQVAS